MATKPPTSNQLITLINDSLGPHKNPMEKLTPAPQATAGHRSTAAASASPAMQPVMKHAIEPVASETEDPPGLRGFQLVMGLPY